MSTTYGGLLAAAADAVKDANLAVGRRRFDSQLDAAQALVDYHGLLDALAGHTWVLLTPEQAAGIRASQGPRPVEVAAIGMAEAIGQVTGTGRPHPDHASCLHRSYPHGRWRVAARTDDVGEGIKDMILPGELRPGDRLPVEKDLAARLNLSRSSLREGVRALTLMGVLRSRQRDGTYATALQLEQLFAPVTFAAETEAAGLAARFIAAEQLQEADDILVEAEVMLRRGGKTDHELLLAADRAGSMESCPARPATLSLLPCSALCPPGRRELGCGAASSKKAPRLEPFRSIAAFSRHSRHTTSTGRDYGWQYTSIRLTEHLALEEIRPSIGSVGDAYDNALMETINGLYKAECIRTTVFHDGPYKTLADVEYATAGWVDWYNNRRLHSSLGNVPPVEYDPSLTGGGLVEGVCAGHGRVGGWSGALRVPGILMMWPRSCGR